MLSPHIKFNHSPRVLTGTHPGHIKAGDFVNLGASFCIVHYGGKGCIQMRLDSVAVTRSESVYACNFAICTNRYRLQRPDTKAPGNTTEREGYNACNEITRVKLGGAHDLT